MVLIESTVKRIAKDVKFILKNPLDNENIYYNHSQEDILKGYALIIGQKDTPYAYGYYFFEFNFPENYPFEPPKVKFLTNDGIMRFNPNLYANGKVCLSVLNTWNGEGWTSCQSIYSILITLSAVFNENPLINEPGIKKEDLNVVKYNCLVSYKNIEYSIIKQFLILKDLEKNDDFSNNSNVYYYTIYLFRDVLKKTLTNNYENICRILDIDNNRYSYLIDNNNNNNNNLITITTYNLEYTLNYDNLKNNLKDLNILRI
jgi:ubiquitin-conjugating enzyme E2 Z